MNKQQTIALERSNYTVQKFFQTNNMKNKYLYVLFKDYRILKITFIILTSFLLIDDMYVFLVSKPTLTSVTQTNIQTNNFPDILICPDQAFDLHSLHKIGYKISTHYGRGNINSQKNLISWTGNQTEMNLTEVAQQISKFKILKDCPKVQAKFKIIGLYKVNYIILDVELTRVIYPKGRCCRVIKPKEADKYVLIKVV